MKKRVMNAMRTDFRPEFLNRLDDFVIFNSLGRSEMRGITALELKKVSQRLKDKQITLRASEDALDFLSDVSSSP
jgi:ATP-dependent Clp protease ATP-binding subunit ClpB